MNKDLMREVEIANGVEVSFSGKDVVVKGNGKELKRSFEIGKIQISVSPATGNGEEAMGKVILEAKGASKREAKMMGTIWAHLKNMIKGVGEDFVYELEVCHVHFPMNVKAEGKKILIKSFLGETTVREAKIVGDVKVDISGNKITVTGSNIENAGQTAANLEKATRLTGRDRRIFQDGIFITKKPYRTI